MKVMKMMKNNPWISLNASMNSKRCTAEHKYNFFWAIGKNNEYIFAIEHSNLEDWPNKKLNLSGIEIEQYQIPNGYRLILKLHDNSDWDLFINLCNDLLQATNESENEKTMLSIVYNRLQRWQKLFRKAGKRLLSSEEQQGLVGELYFLKTHLFKKYPEQEVLSFWRGPYGEQQDFGIGDIAVEVKTKRGTTIPYVQISSADQLDCRNTYCYLYVVTLNSSPKTVEGAFSLNDLVSDIKKIIESTETIEFFESLLLEIGYIEMPEYSENYYLISQTSAYQIKDAFPKISAENLSNGINSVQYRIELHACRDYEITIETFNERISNE